MSNLYAGFLSIIKMASIVDSYAAEFVEATHVKQFTSRDPQLNAEVDAGEEQLLDVAERYNNGEMSQEDFEREYLALLLLLMLRAAIEATGTAVPANASPNLITRLANDALPIEALREIASINSQNTQAVNRLANDIANGRYSERDSALPNLPAQDPEEARGKLRNRVILWAIAIAAAVGIGRLYTADKLMWVYGPTEHCDDCNRLNGQVHTREAWAASQWRPQGANLQCGGWRCQCQLREVDPTTPENGSF